MDLSEFFKMGWKHFWINNPQTKTDGYSVNSYGALSHLKINHNKEGKAYESIWLKYGEIIEILNLKTKEQRYRLCDKFFNEKFLQSENEKKELSKLEQSKLEKLFP